MSSLDAKFVSDLQLAIKAKDLPKLALLIEGGRAKGLRFADIEAIALDYCGIGVAELDALLFEVDHYCEQEEERS